MGGDWMGNLTGWRLLLGLCLTFVMGLALAPAAGAAGCPNEALREAQHSTALPGCMALESVSPPQKFSQPAYLPSFSRNGARLQMTVLTALAETPGYQFYGGDSYIAGRGASGWQITPTSPLDPALLTASGRRWGSVFTPELNRWAQFASTRSQYQVGVAQLFAGGLDGSFSPLSPLLVPIDNSGTDKTQQAVEDLEFSGASADLSAGVLRVTLGSTSYLPRDPRRLDFFLPEPGGDRNSYVAFLDEAGEPALELLARDKDGVVYGGRCGAHLGGSGATFNQGNITPLFTGGAISPEGSRIYFSTRPAQPWDSEEDKGPTCDIDNGLRILKRVATGGTAITEIAPGGGGPSAPGDDLFQAASADGSKVYFLSPRKLSASDTDSSSGPCSGNLGASQGCDLYLYDETKPESERIVLASDADGSEEADVLNSTTAVSGDGARAYFVAQGVLTADANPEGDTAAAGQPNLYLYEAAAEKLSFLATLVNGDAAGMWDTKGTLLGDAYAAPLHGAGSEAGGDGHVLAFASKASVTDDDGDGGFRDVFRYDADDETLERISKAVSGGEDNGPFDVSVNPAFSKELGSNFGEATRWVSEDGQLIGFATAEPLIPGDEDEAINPYAWDAGELGAVFAPILEGGAGPPAVSPPGGQIAFATATALLPGDKDVVEDVYVARANGGFSELAPPTLCNPLNEDSCQGPPPPPPGMGTPATATSTAGNVRPSAKCKKGFVKRKGKCVKRPGKRKAGKRAGARRGGRS